MLLEMLNIYIYILLDGSAAGQPLLHDIHFLHCCAEHTHKAPLAFVANDMDIDKHMRQQSQHVSR